MTKEEIYKALEFARENMYSWRLTKEKTEITSLEALEAIKDWYKCFVPFGCLPVEFEIIKKDLMKLEEIKQWVKSFECKHP